MWTEDYRWHYDYVRLAWDTGFCFNKYKYPNLDKNKICLVDIDRIIRERDVASVERQIPTVVQFVLESDQAEVLDTNFVKMFRISQLSVEYLLFCKKYLDNTVVLLKKEMSKLKEENKELKLFTEELENHISSLMKHNDTVTTFKCNKCPKVFSAEEYLNSHIKRRHSEESKESTTTETDQLQSEIKQLKERLNVAEKLLQEKDEKIDKENSDLENKVKVNEIIETFERFKEKVDNDIKMLQIEKNIYEDKYGKLLEVVLHYKNKENEIVDSTQQKSTLVEKIETTTQTEKGNPDKKLRIETVHNRNVYDFQDPSLNRENDIQDKIEQKINEFEEHIESKISSGLCNIESQMQAFWGKLTELEVNREKILPTHESSIENIAQQVPDPPTKVIKPEIKPRTKFSKPTKIVDYNNEENAKKIKNELEKMYSRPKSATVKSIQKVKPEVKVVKPSNVMYDTSPTSESESENISESVVEVLPEKKYEKKPSLSTLGKRSITSLRNAAKSKEVIEKLREELVNILNDRLQEIGISPNWKGIPQKTFDKSLEIVQHQATLAKKSYPEFDSIKKSLEKSLKNRKDLKQNTKKTAKVNASPNTPVNVINISYRKKPKDLDAKPEERPPVVTIKNRSLYDTDTDSEPLQPNKPTSEEVPAYSAVIKELKKSQTRNADTDSDVNSVVFPKENRNEPQTKSALKNYPSLGSLTKKKVLFDIETDESKVEDDDLAEHVVGESTTSVASSELDVLQDIEEQKQKKDDSISDFDLSEL